MTTSDFKALLVDDDACWLEILHELLIGSSLTVDMASNLPEALALLKAQPYRLAVVDLSLSTDCSCNMDGLSVLESIHRLNPGCQAILLTGFATVELAVDAMSEYGAFSVMRKERFQREEFGALVRRALKLDEKLTRLTKREREVLHCLVQGLTNKEIATKLFITPNTVKRHIKAIFVKLEVNTRSAVVAQVRATQPPAWKSPRSGAADKGSHR